MTEAYNGFASATEEMPYLNEDWVRVKLMEVFDNVDIEELLEQEFGRGIIMGQLRVLWEIEQAGENDSEEDDEES